MPAVKEVDLRPGRRRGGVPGGAPGGRRGGAPRTSALVSFGLYRLGFLAVVPLLLLTLVGAGTPRTLARGSLPESFDGAAALADAVSLTARASDRSPETPGAGTAQAWVESRFRAAGLSVSRQRFTAPDDAGRERQLVNVLGVARPPNADLAPADTPARALVLLAHRDDQSPGPGANDGAAGTAVLIELARSLVGTNSGLTVVFASTDGGLLGAAGARHLAAHPPPGLAVGAAIALEGVGRAGPLRLLLETNGTRRPAAGLVRSLATFLDSHGLATRPPSGLAQLASLLAPVGRGEQAPFTSHGIAAVALDGTPTGLPSSADPPSLLSADQLARVGGALQSLILAFDAGPPFDSPASSYVLLGDRVVRGWAIELVLLALCLPPALVAFDIAVRARRRGIRLAPAAWALVERTFPGVVLVIALRLEGAIGLVPGGHDPPFPPSGGGVGALAIALPLIVAGGAWLVLRRHHTRVVGEPDEAGVAGFVTAVGATLLAAPLLWLANPYLVALVVPALHVWLLLPALSRLGGAPRLTLALAGLAGPAALLALLAGPAGLGASAPVWLLRMLADGTIGLPAALGGVLLVTSALQLVAIVAGRYASDQERRPARLASRGLDSAAS